MPPKHNNSYHLPVPTRYGFHSSVPWRWQVRVIPPLAMELPSTFLETALVERSAGDGGSCGQAMAGKVLRFSDSPPYFSESPAIHKLMIWIYHYIMPRRMTTF